MAIPSFVDRVVLHAAAGNGGHGCVSVHREKFKPLGGPDGGNGGNGGDVVLVVDPNVTTLLDYHRRPHQRAASGTPGMGSNRAGAHGRDVVLAVPDGTTVTTDGELVVDLTGAGTRFVLARGGRGGLGNAALATAKRKAPGFALLGEPGETRDVVLELKSMADVGLVGLPSAGKSSLVAAMSAARPAIADYPFTTLAPNLGVVEADEVRFTVADVPGLIEGASEGRGLGHEFLRHVERCAVLVHVVDCATLEPGRDPITDIDVIEAELERYGRLAEQPRLVALNKVDVPEAEELAEFVRGELADRDWPVVAVSAAAHTGLRELTFAMAEIVQAARDAAPPAEPTRLVLRPAAVDDTEFTVTDEGVRYRVRGGKPERWVHQTDFGNDEAVGYLADRLNRLGVERALLEAGAEPGDEVVIGGADAVVFDWVPTAEGGTDVVYGPRGTDPRLEQG